MMELEDTIPFIGRYSELESLMAHLSLAMGGEGGLVLISGEAGSGKTALCGEFARLAKKGDCLILIGRCIPSALSPFLPFMEAFHGLKHNPFSVPKDSVYIDRERLLLAILETVEMLSREKPTLLFIEDLHWADSSSIGMIHFLARNIRTSRALIVGTYRPEDIHATASDEVHPLNEALRVMRREQLCNEVALHPLSEDEIGKMAQLRLGGTIDGRLSDMLITESGGNPLFAVEILRFLKTNDGIVHEEGGWKLREGQEPEIPPTIRDVVMARVEQIPRDALEVLESASVIGERFDLGLLTECLGLRTIDVLKTLERLENEHQLIEEIGKGYKFTHDKVRQVIYENISRQRREETHRLLGAILEKGLPNDDLLDPLSRHFDKADENVKCVQYSLLAGELCLKRNAYPEAKKLFHLVLERTTGSLDLTTERLRALEGLGGIGLNLSGLKEWYSYYEQFLELNKDRKARAKVLAKAAECWDQMGLADIDVANRMLEEAESLAEGDPEILAIVEFRRAEISNNAGNRTATMYHAERARDYFETIGDREGQFLSMTYEALCLRQGYRYADAREIWEELLKEARAMGRPNLIIRALTSNANIMGRLGEIELAKTYASEAIPQARKLGQTWMWRLALHNRALALELEGDFSSARKDLMMAYDDARENGIKFHTALFAIDLGICETDIGLLEDAEKHFHEGLEILESFDAWFRLALCTNLGILKAELLASKSLIEQSDEVYVDGIEFFKDRGWKFDLVDSLSRHGISLARRGMLEEARARFDDAMRSATEIGCEKRVRALAGHASIDMD